MYNKLLIGLSYVQEGRYPTSNAEDEGEYHGGADKECTERRSLKIIQRHLSSDFVAIDAN
jgi:hypothetical protein